MALPVASEMVLLMQRGRGRKEGRNKQEKPFRSNDLIP